MSCPSQCYTIGGPWISYDPNCPFHGDEARAAERERCDARHHLEEALEEAKTFDELKSVLRQVIDRL